MDLVFSFANSPFILSKFPPPTPAYFDPAPTYLVLPNIPSPNIHPKMKFYSFHPGMNLTCKQNSFHPGIRFISVTCKHTLRGLYGNFHPRLKFQFGIPSWKKVQLYEKFQPGLKYNSFEKNRKIRRLMKEQRRLKKEG